MANFAHGRRRRRILVQQTGPVVSAGQSNPVQPSRQIQPRIIRRPDWPARITILKSPQLHGSYQGARPPVLVVRLPPQRRSAPPTIVRPRSLPNIPPPTQRLVPRPQVVPDYSRQARWRPVQVKTQPGRLPSPAMPAPAIVGRWRPGPVPIRPRIYSTHPVGPTLGIPPHAALVVRRPVAVRSIPAIFRATPPIAWTRTLLPRALAIRLPIIPWRVRPVVNLRTPPQSTARPAPRVVVPPQAAVVRTRPALPWGQYQISARTRGCRPDPAAEADHYSPSAPAAPAPTDRPAVPGRPVPAGHAAAAAHGISPATGIADLAPPRLARAPIPAQLAGRPRPDAPAAGFPPPAIIRSAGAGPIQAAHQRHHLPGQRRPAA